MLATKINFENRTRLEEVLLKLETEFLERSIKAPAPSPESIQAFAKMPDAQQEQILTNIAAYVEILSQDLNKTADSKDFEKARLKAALKRFSLRPASDDVFNIIEQDEVVEIYNLKGIQLYRNMCFFKLCSYSLLDISVHPWSVLYDRPQFAIDALGKIVERLFTSGDDPIPYNLPPFVQKEKCEFMGTMKSVEALQRFIVPLFSTTNGEPAGAFSTCAGRVIAEGEQSSRFSTLK